jgi:hypothetical protein
MSDSENLGLDSPDRRDFLLLGLSATALVALSSAPCLALTSVNSPDTNRANMTMSKVTTQDGADIFYKDWGPKNAQPIVFHPGWPLSSDDWDSQLNACRCGQSGSAEVHSRLTVLSHGSAARRAMAGFMDRPRHCSFLSAWIHPDFSAASSALWSFAF